MPNELSKALTRAEKKQLETDELKIRAGLATFIDVGNALADIHEKKLYRAEFETFDAYCSQKWGFSRQHAARLENAADTVAVLEDAGATSLPLTEAVARPLGAVPDVQKPEVWQAAQSAAVEAGKPAPTAKQVVAAVAQVLPPEKPAKKKAPAKATQPRLPAIEAHERAECLKRICKFAGAAARQKIERTGLDDKSLATFAKQGDEDIPKVWRCLSLLGMTVGDALKLLRVMPAEKTKLATLCDLAVAEGGWEGDIDGVHIVCTPSRRKR